MMINMNSLAYQFKENGDIQDIEVTYSTYRGRERFNAAVVITQDDLPQPIENYNAVQLDAQAKRIIREWTLLKEDEEEDVVDENPVEDEPTDEPVEDEVVDEEEPAE